VKSLTENSAPTVPWKTLKRKVGYAHEEVSKTRAKLDRMTIDEPIEKAGEIREKESEPQEGYLD
jgi:hypothetical protein